MAPIRRYLRITKYSVLECRIYLDNPALANSWLLNPRNPILPKVIESVRHLVLPKLREERERERSRKKSSKKKNIKDVVTKDEFEVSVFLTETPTRHSILTKHKTFRDKTSKLKSNSNRLIGETNSAPVDVDVEETRNGTAEPTNEPIVLQEESDEEPAAVLENLPAIDEAIDEATRPRRSKRPRAMSSPDLDEEFRTSSSEDEGEEEEEEEEEADGIAVEIDSDEAEDARPPTKRRRKQLDKTQEGGEEEMGSGEDDDKKKLAMDVSFEGFAIYGRVLCLVVKKRPGAGTSGTAAAAGKSASSKASAASGGADKLAGQAVMENWIGSTQAPNPGAEEDVS